jgi:hypothetical protein
LQVLLVQGIGDLLDERREAVAVGPQDVLDIKVDAVVAILFGLADEGSDECVLRLGIVEEGVGLVLIEECEEWNEGNVRVFRGLHDAGLRLAADETILVDLVPGRGEDVDLVFVGHEVGDGGQAVAHPELSFLRLRGEGAKHERTTQDR